MTAEIAEIVLDPNVTTDMIHFHNEFAPQDARALVHGATIVLTDETRHRFTNAGWDGGFPDGRLLSDAEHIGTKMQVYWSKIQGKHVLYGHLPNLKCVLQLALVSAYAGNNLNALAAMCTASLTYNGTRHNDG